MGTASAKEIAFGVRKAMIDAQNNMISIPLTRGFSFPHKQDGIAGGAKVMLRPASEGTGTCMFPEQMDYLVFKLWVRALQRKAGLS